MTRKQRRLTMIGGSLAVLAVAAALVLNAMRDSIVFFSTPAMVAEKHVAAGKRFRLGGLVLRKVGGRVWRAVRWSGVAVGHMLPTMIRAWTTPRPWKSR